MGGFAAVMGSIGKKVAQKAEEYGKKRLEAKLGGSSKRPGGGTSKIGPDPEGLTGEVPGQSAGDMGTDTTSARSKKRSNGKNRL